MVCSRNGCTETQLGRVRRSRKMDVGTRKGVFTLLVICCCAVLWPKIFYPVLQACFWMFASDDAIRVPADPNYFPTHMREAMGESRPDDGANQKSSAKLLSHPSGRWGPAMQSQGSGAFGIVMPFYTIAVAIFFAYTILKLLLKKQCPHAKMPLEKSYAISNVCRSLNVSSQDTGGPASANTPLEGPPLDCRTKQLLREYGRERVVNALKTLIEEMAEGKPNPLIEKWKLEQVSPRQRNGMIRKATFANSVK